MDKYSWNREAALEHTEEKRYRLGSIGKLCSHAVYRNDEDKKENIGLCDKYRTPNCTNECNICPVGSLLQGIVSKTELVGGIHKDIKELGKI